MFVETRWVASRRISAGGMSWRLGAGIAFADMTAETRIAAVWAVHMSAGRACVGSYGKYSQKAAGTLEGEYAALVYGTAAVGLLAVVVRLFGVGLWLYATHCIAEDVMGYCGGVWVSSGHGSLF